MATTGTVEVPVATFRDSAGDCRDSPITRSTEMDIAVELMMGTRAIQ
jgi:hypothetical protein